MCIYQRFLPPDCSGAGKQALTLAHLLRRRGFQVVLLGDLQPGSDAPDHIEGVPVRWVEAPVEDGSYLHVLEYWGRLGVELARLRTRFDVLHVHSAAFYQAAAVPMARLLGKRVIVRASIAGEFDNLARSRSGRIQRRMFALSDGFVVLSRHLVREFQASGLPGHKLHLIQNGVDEGRYHPVCAAEKQALRRELGLLEDGRLLIYHGVFIERKSLHWLVDAIGPVLERYGLTLLMVGDPARDEPKTGYAARLDRQIAAHPCRERIIVRGFDPQVHRYLKAADLYVLPSTSEGMPNALLEAMAVGLVPIASRTSGSEDVVEQGVSGFLFEPRNVDEILACLDHCCGLDDARLSAVSAAAVRRIRADFTIQATGSRYGDLYQRLSFDGRRHGPADMTTRAVEHPGPDFVCIGAQKAGTTWLYDNLVGQRLVWMPPEKEIHFFNTVCPNEELTGVEVRQPPRGWRAYEPLLRHPSVQTLKWLRRFHRDARSTRWYYSLFPPEMVGTRLAGDITPAYSTLDARGVAFARRVLRPGCRVMLIVRNPIDRVWSGLKMAYRWKKEELPEGEVESLLRQVAEPTHRLRGDYARMVRLWGDAFGDDFRVFRYDRLSAAPVEFLAEVGEFLGARIEADPRRLGKRSNPDPERKRIPAALREQLAEVFRPGVEELERLVPGITEGWLEGGPRRPLPADRVAATAEGRGARKGGGSEAAARGRATAP